MTKRKPTPSTDYPAGYFTALIREHNWPPRFESKLNYSGLDWKRHVAGQWARAVAITTGAGWGNGTIVLPNTPKWRMPTMLTRSKP
jgi:hypothetical protein